MDVIEKYREMFIENGVKVLEDMELVTELFDNIVFYSGYGFNKSHAAAYAYISARLLWFKAHYPIEFYTAILMCEDSEDKFKEYKLDAKCHGIEVCPVNINKSKANFSINDEKIYFGFSNIKGIGEEVGKGIESNQPYND